MKPGSPKATMPLAAKSPPLRPGEATTYVDLATEFAKKWQDQRTAQLEADVRADLDREAARRSASRNKIRQKAQKARQQRKEDEEAEQHRFRMPEGATLRDVGGRLKTSLHEQERRPRFRWDSAYAPTWVDPQAGPPPTACVHVAVHALSSRGRGGNGGARVPGSGVQTPRSRACTVVICIVPFAMHPPTGGVESVATSVWRRFVAFSFDSSSD